MALGDLDIGSRDFRRLADLWRAKFEALNDLTDAIAEVDLTEFLHKQPVRFRSHQEQFNQIVKHMRLSFLNYERLAEFLRKASPSETDQSQGADVYRKLVSGMLGELKIRRLAT